jgi:light-regulated signal transduction histidine kinase (bacteriophytochrome)
MWFHAHGQVTRDEAGNFSHMAANLTDITDHWQFAVCDNGIGIQSEYLESIFVPFKRLHGDQEYKGNGWVSRYAEEP